MVVQHNLTAMNSNRMLGITTKTQAKSTEKLSSGYKINRAADDAAGLAISEKMRKQMRGLTQASANAQDGISSVQTAEGALTEVHDMLQRMNELAVKAANGTMSEDDRSYVQNEIDQLVTEIDRVSETTKFNETYLLKGDNAETITYNAASSASTSVNGGLTFDSEGEASITIDNSSASVGISVGSTTYTLLQSGSTVTPSANEYNNVDDFVAAIRKAAMTESDGIKEVTYDSKNKEIKFNAFADIANAFSADLHVGADSADTNKIELNIVSMSARSLGVNGLRVDGSDGTYATNAIDTIELAIQKVSTQRSALGAAQNRLEHTINNLDNVVENTTAAESQIRDTDMATEMVRYSNNNILAQAGQSMLAQANQSNQGVMSLLQ